MHAFGSVLVVAVLMGGFPPALLAAYTDTPHRELRTGEVPVTGPGVYAAAGTTYVLTANVSSATNPIFLGKDVTFDLNGYTLTYRPTAERPARRACASTSACLRTAPKPCAPGASTVVTRSIPR